jgi:hypothetical protein
MASEILGLFTTPDQYNMMQQQALDARALQYAQLNPFQRAEMNLFRGGANLAGGIGSLLGVQDPQLRMISQRQQLSQGLDISDPNAILQRAQQAAEMGDMQFATVLADYARKAQSDIALVQQRSREGKAAATPKELQIAQAKAQLLDQQAQLEAMPDSLEKARSLAVIKNTLAGLSATARQGQIPDAIEIARELALSAGPEGSEAYTAKYNRELERLSTKQTKENLSEFERLLNARYPDTPENAQIRATLLEKAIQSEISGKAKGKGNTEVKFGIDMGKAGEAGGKKLGEEIIDVKGKESALDSISAARQLLDGGQGVYAGAYGPAQQFVAKYTGIGSAEKAARTEEFLAYIGETVVPRLKEFGGNDSEQELAYLNRIMGGDITMEPKALDRILKSAETKIRKGIERLRRQVVSGEKKEPLSSSLPKPREVDNAARPSEPAVTMPAAPAPAVAPVTRARPAAPAAPAPAPAAKQQKGQPKATKRWNPQTRQIEVIK